MSLHPSGFGITWGLFPSTSNLSSHSFSEPGSQQGLDPWDLTSVYL